jgi:pimeloyl-ACP methyl ester carboxylesterase
MTVRVHLMAALLAALLLCGGCLSGCASGRQQATDLAAQGGFQPLRLESGDFVLAAWLRPGAGRLLHVYIEGDGLAWRKPSQPSSDPTPTNPVGLRLALADPARGPVVYLARPCQYVEGADRQGCSIDDWTFGRFSRRVIDAMDKAVDALKARTGADTVALFGYSGGGGVAGILAAKRSDVVFLGTVAGNMDHKLWTRLLGDSPLDESLNTVDYAAATRSIPQLHVIGGRDKTVPAAVVDSWISRVQGGSVARVVIPEAGHDFAWERSWPGILARWRAGLKNEK